MQDAGGRSFARTGRRRKPPLPLAGYRIHTSLRTPLRAHFPLIPSSGASRVSRACPEPAEGDGGSRFGAVLRYAPAGAVATQDEGKGLAAKGVKARTARPAGAPQTSRNEMCACGSARGRGRERASGRAAWQSPGRTKDDLPPRPPDRSPGQALPRKRRRDTMWPSSCPKGQQDMRHAHSDHDIS